MFKQMIFALSALSLATIPAMASAAPCHDAKGKFIKCPDKTKATPKRCKDAHGKFAKCSAPGAKPA